MNSSYSNKKNYGGRERSAVDKNNRYSGKSRSGGSRKTYGDGPSRRAVYVKNSDEISDEEFDGRGVSVEGVNNPADNQTSSPTDDRLEGKNSVLEAFNAEREINKIWILKPGDNQKLDQGLYRILRMAEERKIVVNRVPRLTLDRMSQTHNHQGVIAAVASHEYTEVTDIVAKARAAGHEPFLVVLDELKDSYNLGSILRIADSAGVDGIIIPKHRSIGLDSVVAKASAGAIEYVPVARVTNLTQTLNDLKQDGFWVMGTDAEADIDYDKADYSGALALIVGSEGEGMRNTVKNCCDYLISIPMVGHVNSLNAAVAGGIVVFEAMRQRRQKN